MHLILIRFPGLILLVALHIGAGSFLGAFFPPGLWLEGLVKPAFYPPTWAFPVAWTILYAMMGCSVWLVFKAKQGPKRLALWLYAAQLVVNLAYTPLCFGLESTLLGFLDVGLLLVLLLTTIPSFYQISRTAALLLVPYLLWVCFAFVLSFFIWRLNS